MNNATQTREYAGGMFERSRAVFSACGRHRVELRRDWSTSGPVVNFLMLNPSTADETKNDPTVERCQRRALAGGFAGLVVTNLFSLRSTDPAGLAIEPPNHPANDAHILANARAASLVVCGWGSQPKLGRLVVERAAAVVAKLTAAGVVLHALTVNADGSPGHPLYIPFARLPDPWRGPVELEKENRDA